MLVSFFFIKLKEFQLNNFTVDTHFNFLQFNLWDEQINSQLAPTFSGKHWFVSSQRYISIKPETQVICSQYLNISGMGVDEWKVNRYIYSVLYTLGMILVMDKAGFEFGSNVDSPPQTFIFQCFRYFWQQPVTFFFFSLEGI